MPNTCETPCAASVSTKASLADILVMRGYLRFRVHQGVRRQLRLCRRAVLSLNGAAKAKCHEAEWRRHRSGAELRAL